MYSIRFCVSIYWKFNFLDRLSKNIQTSYIMKIR